MPRAPNWEGNCPGPRGARTFSSRTCASKAGSAVREAQAALDRKVLDRYATLTEARIKTLVVEDKWLAGIRAAIEGEVDRLTQQLSGRVQALEARYAQPLPVLEREVEALGARVEGHLKRMGVSSWA